MRILLAIWRSAELLDAQFVVGELLSVSTVWVHSELSATDEAQSVRPESRQHQSRSGTGQCLLVLAIGIHDEEHHLVSLYPPLHHVVTYLVNHPFCMLG